MKQLICEMCGGTDLIKQDGVFVCQSCGTKYSIEEAKKMMLEGTVEVQGTVKLDSSEELKNFYELARRAKDTENNENASKYYDMILVKDPTSWEANFYSIYFKSMGCKIVDIPNAATAVNNCIESTYKLIKQKDLDFENRKNAINEICEKSKTISKMLFDAANSWMGNIDPLVKNQFQMQYLSAVLASAGIEKTICDKLCIIFEDDDEIMSNVSVQLLKDRIAAGVVTDAQSDVDYVKTIQKYDSSYEPPRNQTVADITSDINTQTNSNGGCYVATCVYGSYDCPQVWTLRRYRDYELDATWYGRTFIKTYYAISPTIVKWFGNSSWFKKFWKGKLDKMVVKLQKQGYDNTRYEDKEF